MAYIINGETISDQVIEDEFESIKEHYLNAGEAVCCDRDEEFMAYARENVVNRVLMEQASVAKFGEVADAAVDAKFNQIVSEHGGETAFYENTGFNRGDELMLRRKVKSSLMVDRFLEAELGDESDPTDDELKAFYEEHIDQYKTDVQVQTNQLFIEPTSHEAAKDTYETLCRARGEILDGADFIELAAQHSGLEKEEVQMGYIRQGENMPEIESVVFSMRPGEVSPILATPFGFHLFQVTGRKEPEPIPMEQIQDLEHTYLVQRREKNIAIIIERLTNEGSVEEVTEAE